MSGLSPHEHLKIAKRLHFQGQHDEAINEYLLVLELDPGNQDAISGLNSLEYDIPDQSASARGPVGHQGGLKTSFFVNQATEGHKSVVKQGPFKIVIFLLGAGMIYGLYLVAIYFINFENVKAMQNVEIHFERPLLKEGAAKVNIRVDNFNPAPIKKIEISYGITDDKGNSIKDGKITLDTPVPAGDHRTFSDVSLGEIKGQANKMNPKLEMLKYGPIPKLKPTQVDKFIDCAGRPDKDALQDYNDFVSDNEDFAPGWVGLGRAYAARANYKSAVEQYKKALELDPENYNAHYHMAISMYYLGDKAGARKEMDEANKYQPDDPNILFGYKMLEAMKDAKDKADKDKAAKSKSSSKASSKGSPAASPDEEDK